MRNTKFKSYKDLSLTLTAPEVLPLDIFDDLPV